MTTGHPFSILLIDDDDVAAEAVVRGLRKHELLCPIVLAEDGHIALQVLRAQHATRRIAKPFLALMDLNMPGMGGLELLPKAKAMRPDVPIIMITAYGDAETKRKALEDGAEALLTKPIDFGTLRSEIDMRVERAA